MNIGIYAGGDIRVFSGSTLHTSALGGIQTSIVLLATELSNYHNIYVFNPISEDCVEYGVNYINYAALDNYADRLDVIITTSHEGFAIDSRLSSIPLNIFWKHHNEPYLEDGMDEFLDVVDIVVFGSKYSMDAYSNYYQSDKYRVIYPGIDIDSIYSNTHRLPHLVYISCPNRGLDMFTSILPSITKEIPDIELHSYGTFQTYGDSWKSSDDEFRGMRNYRILSAMDNFYQLDSVPYYDLLGILSSALILAYPCVFLESFCAATAMAMACGTPVVSTMAGAHRTLYPGHPHMIDVPDDDLGMVSSDCYTEAFTDHVVNLYHDVDLWESTANVYRNLARRYDIHIVGRNWLDMIEEML